eukprot:CAMPEP_0115868244 /NCGR_PEP_ID=MMETSP0287-20121206/21192_2 /TAXON_ID=412157 /ORGANISM="Chrysochromulina rotalis, Strain UIO044" /LENGTH=60 /DNA_ID=CAMNT_0003322891 /DNA_START=89 /DNA_END=268 /DNA_ORIENTATION=-
MFSILRMVRVSLRVSAEARSNCGIWPLPFPMADECELASEDGKLSRLTQPRAPSGSLASG